MSRVVSASTQAARGSGFISKSASAPLGRTHVVREMRRKLAKTSVSLSFCHGWIFKSLSSFFCSDYITCHLSRAPSRFVTGHGSALSHTRCATRGRDTGLALFSDNERIAILCFEAFGHLGVTIFSRVNPTLRRAMASQAALSLPVKGRAAMKSPVGMHLLRFKW